MQSILNMHTKSSFLGTPFVFLAFVKLTFARGSFDLMARNAEKAAVPPPISKYGTCFGNSADVAGTVGGIAPVVPQSVLSATFRFRLVNNHNS